MLIPTFKLLSSFFLSLYLCFAALAQTPLPSAIGGNIAGDDTSTRFFVNFSQNIAVLTSYMESPYRIIMALSEASFDFDPKDVFKPRGLISDVSAGRISDGRSRIVLTL